MIGSVTGMQSASWSQIECRDLTRRDRPFGFDEAMEVEQSLLASAAESARLGEERLTIALWETEQAIVLPSGMSRRDGIADASHRSGESGWPVYERRTGGDVTPQFAGVLNISMGFPLYGRDRNIPEAYRRLTDPLVTFIDHAFGISSSTASVEGAFCDGTYNLVIDGRKIAGTAQRWRQLPTTGANELPATAVMAHAALLCGGDLPGALTAVNRFFDWTPIGRRVNPAVHVTLADLVGREKGTPEAVAAAFAHSISAMPSQPPANRPEESCSVSA